MSRKFEVWSFFSGAMGLDLGFEAAGLPPQLAVEVDKWCCATIRANRPDVTLIDRGVEKLDAKQLRAARSFVGDVDVLIGGPPCQSFSPGGKRAGLKDPRGNLIYEYIRLIADVRPRQFLFENVANLVTAAIRHRPIESRPGKHWNLAAYDAPSQSESNEDPALEPDELSGSAIRQMLKDFGGLGYAVNFGVLDAADFGAPQHRLRFVMMGSRDGPAPCLPQPTHGPSLLPYRTVREAIYDLRNSPGAHSEYGPEMTYYFSHVPPGGSWRNLPIDLQKAAMGGAFNSGGGKTGFYRRLSWDNPAPTITGRANRKASAFCHPSHTRPLSAKECARIQGFPDDWEFVGAMAQQYLQVGNAVPLALGEACARAFLSGRTMDQTGDWLIDSEQMLQRAVKRLRASARNKRGRQQETLPLRFEDRAA